MNHKKENQELLEQPNFLMLIIVSAITVFLDQSTKYAILVNIPLHGEINIVPNFFSLVHFHNPGGAFGFMSQGSPATRGFLFIGISFLAVILIVYFYRSIPRSYKLLSFSLALIVGGALGNIFDRLKLGKVIDFIDISIYSYHWPAFNFADSAITIGSLIFTIYIILKKIPE